MHTVLQRYVGQDIGLNWEKPQRFERMRLLDATPTRFTVSAGRDEPVLHYGTAFILSIAEGRFEVGGLGEKTHVPVLVQLSAWRP